MADSIASQYKIAKGRLIAQKAADEGRPLTTAEVSEIEGLIKEVNEDRENARLLAMKANGGIDPDEKALAEALRKSGINGKVSPSELERGLSAGTSLWGAALAAGVKANPGQVVRYQASMDATATKELISDADSSGDLGAELPSRQEAGVNRLPIAQRYLYPVFGGSDIAVGEASVEYLRQDGRELASADSDGVQPFGATGTKPTTSSHVELVREPAQMVATLSEYIPNGLLARQDLRDVVDADCRLALATMLDDYVVGKVLDDPDTSTGGDDLIEAIITAQSQMRDGGYNPTVTALSSDDYLSIVLARSDSTGVFFLSSIPELGTLRVVDGVESGSPVCIDPSGFSLYIGGTAVDADGFSQFDTNETRLRFEFPALFVVRRPDAACVATVTSA